MAFFQNLVNALQWGSFYALIALGYSMVYGVLMLFNFAHGDIFMVGAYIGFFVSTGLVSLASLGAIALPNWLILVLTIILSMFLTCFVGMFVERVGYRPLRNAAISKPRYFAFHKSTMRSGTDAQPRPRDHTAGVDRRGRRVPIRALA